MSTGSVAVLGLGQMGASLAEALMATGHQVSVWNRTAGRAEQLAASGVRVAADPRGAVQSSDVVVLCVDRVSTCVDILRDTDLQGRVLVQVTSGTPEDVQGFERWATERGAEVIEGMILVYPSAIGTERSRILYAGAEPAMLRADSVLDAFGGRVHVGSEVGSVSALAVAARALYLISTVALVAGLEAARRLGAPLETTLDEMARLQTTALDGVRSSLGWVRRERPETGAEGVTVARLAESSADVSAYFSGLGMDASLLDAARGHLERAVAAGEGGSPIGAIALTLGPDATQ